MAVVYGRVLPMAIVGALVMICISIWWCCRCCGKCKKTEQSTPCNTFLVVGCLALVISSLVLVIVGLGVGQSQSDAMQAVPGLVENIEDYTSDAGG
jgi:protein tweety